MSELENEEDVCVTLTNLVEIVDEEEKLIENADAVLGASDDKNCTYLMGYVGRQALYSCLTCKDQSTDKLSAGICLACSLSCHVGHDLVELYTKRLFRCDCGNSKFPVGFACKLCPDKVALNNNNKYNQNFSGLYCTCSRPYPDPEDSIDDEMVQCIVCEDWFHERHLSSSLKFDSDDYEEMMCVKCVERCSFIWSYVNICKASYEDSKPFSNDDQKPDESNIDVLTVEDKSIETTFDCSDKRNFESSENDVLKEESLSSNKKPEKHVIPNCSVVDDCSSSSTPKVCLLDLLENPNAELPPSPIFWPPKWRKRLCDCSKCKDLYEAKGVSYLLSADDSLTDYEEKGKTNSIKNRFNEHMSNMNHVQKVELISGYMDLKTGLSAYLKKFAENGKVVREEDIAEFFTDLRAKKRRKTDAQQYAWSI